MTYQLNSEYDLGDGATLVNPTWKLAPYIDDWETKKLRLYAYLSIPELSLNHHREVGVYDYSEAGTYEDADVFAYVLTLPGFSQSTIIE